MPAWRPGAYRIQDFGRAVRNVTATDTKGRNLQVSAGEGPTWSVQTTGCEEVEIRYHLPLAVGAGPRRSVAVPAAEQETRKQVLYHHAYAFEGQATWMYVPGRLDVAQHVSFELPESWHVASSMRPTGRPNAFTAPSYGALADCAFHIGSFETLSFELAGIPYRLVLSGFRVQRKQREALMDRTSRIVKAQLQMMGKAPFSDYTFLLACTSGLGGGGSDDFDSTCSANSASISVPAMVGSTRHHNSRFDSLMSHRFFHLWNGNRLRPLALDAPDYTKPARTRYLWFCEGVTSYYGDLCCVRAGVFDEKRYWTHGLAAKINKLQSNPGRQRISVADASWTAWDHSAVDRSTRRQAPDFANKGELLALLLDVRIRHVTNGKASLDDVMRGLYRQCRDTGKGFADGEVRRWCERVSGTSFAQFFADYVDGTVELPFTEELGRIGLIARPADSKPTKDGESPGRRRPPPWRVRLDDTAGERAVRLRTDMTRRIKD